MELKRPPTPNSNARQDATWATSDGLPALPLRSRVRRWIRLALLALPFLGLAAVFFAPWLFPGHPVGNFTVTPPNPMDVGDRLVGPIFYTLDARASELWAFFDFSRGSAVEVPHQFGVDWDLAFQRHKILANGGATNPKGRGAILNLGHVAFDEVREAPAEGYVEDSIASINPEVITTENLAIKAWYHYNFLTHVLRPKPNIYAIRTADGKYAKLRIVSYYCDGGQASGCFTIEYVYQGDGSRRFVLHQSMHSKLAPVTSEADPDLLARESAVEGRMSSLSISLASATCRGCSVANHSTGTLVNAVAGRTSCGGRYALQRDMAYNCEGLGSYPRCPTTRVVTIPAPPLPGP